MNAVLRSPPLARLQTESMRIDVERVSGSLHVRIRPSSTPVGVSEGPRVGIEMIPDDARALAALLVSQADAVEGEM